MCQKIKYKMRKTIIIAIYFYFSPFFGCLVRYEMPDAKSARWGKIEKFLLRQHEASSYVKSCNKSFDQVQILKVISQSKYRKIPCIPLIVDLFSISIVYHEIPTLHLTPRARVYLLL